MREARYDVLSLFGSRYDANGITAAEATRLVNELEGAARVRFHGDDSGQRVPWPLPLEVAGDD